MSKNTFALFAALIATIGNSSFGSAAPFKIFMISSTAVDHLAMSAAARSALPVMGMANDFTVDATTDNTLINEANLAKYDVFLSMHLAPFEIKAEQRAAFENFIKSGKGWVGVHAAGLIIPTEYPARMLPTWDFYSTLMGGTSYVVHPMLQTGTLIIEDRTHPATKNLPATFQIKDEWYEWSSNPRPNVRILGKADETSYKQVKPAGDHPMIWTNEKYQRAIYIETGHDATDWQNPNYNILIRDALLWAAGRLGTPNDGGADAGDGAADGSSDAPASVDGSAGGSSGSGGAGGQPMDAAADVAVGSGGAGGSASGSGGQAATGSGGAVAHPMGSSGGCAMSGVRGSGSASAGSDAGLRSTVLVLIGLVVVARRRARRR